MLKTCLIVVSLAFTAPAHAQDKIATTIFLAGASIDNVSTWRVMNAGHQEANPLYAFTKEQPIGVSLSLIATDVVTLWVAHRLAPKHPKFVKAMLFTLGGVRAGQGLRNEIILAHDPH